jgi:hypothetical protein
LKRLSKKGLISFAVLARPREKAESLSLKRREGKMVRSMGSEEEEIEAEEEEVEEEDEEEEAEEGEEEEEDEEVDEDKDDEEDEDEEVEEEEGEEEDEDKEEVEDDEEEEDDDDEEHWHWRWDRLRSSLHISFSSSRCGSNRRPRSRATEGAECAAPTETTTRPFSCLVELNSDSNERKWFVG